MNLGEAAALFGISRSSFSARAKVWILAGKLHPLQVNGEGRVYYPPWELEELLESVINSLFDRILTAA